MKYLLTTLFALALVPAFSQIKLQIEVLPDNETYQVSFVSDVTYSPPLNLLASSQITIRVPHGLCENRFVVEDLTVVGGGNWNSTRVDAPVESPSWDYIFFGLSQASPDYMFQQGATLPILTFKNGANFCAHQVEIIDNITDPFLPPNSTNTNIANSIVVLGGGINNLFDGVINDGIVDCLPVEACVEETVENVYLCPGQTYMGMTFTQDTTFEAHYTSCMGCDSAFITNVYSWLDSFPPVDTGICVGNDFFGVTINQNEVITQTLQSFGGCDSTITYNVSAITSVATQGNVTIHPGQAVNGIPIFSDSTLVENLTSYQGCDSVHTTIVDVVQVPVFTINEELCTGEMYQGQMWPSDTTWIDTLQTSLGFDSLVVTNIFVHPVYQIVEHVNLCEGEIFNGQVYMADDTLTGNFQTYLGCDSTTITYIDVQEVTTFSLDTTVCAGDMIFGEVYEYDTTFVATVPNSMGCDSIIYLTNLVVLPVPQASISGVLEVCGGETSELTVIGGLDYSWSTGETGSSIIVDTPNDYSVTATNGFGCSDEASVTVEVSSLEVEIMTEAPLCFGDVNGRVEFTNVQGGFPPYAFSIDGGGFFTTQTDFLNLDAGSYELIVEDGGGCSWTETVNLNDPADFILDLGPDLEISLGDEIDLTAVTNFSNLAEIQWLPESDSALCEDCLSQFITPLETTTYRLILTDSSGCRVEASRKIVVDAGRDVYVPTAFSPNGDGSNDLLTVQAGDNVVQVRQFLVFERWGGLVFQNENFQPNDFSIGWNGEWDGDPAQTGTYVWMAEVEFIDGIVEVFEGGVLLVR